MVTKWSPFGHRADGHRFSKGRVHARRIIKNIFPYDVWDGYEVSDHLMIVPKQHTETIGDFSKEELQEYVNILAKYEKMGYSIYARAPQNKRKTVPHEHTHLIMLNYDKPVKWLFNVKSKILWYK